MPETNLPQTEVLDKLDAAVSEKPIKPPKPAPDKKTEGIIRIASDDNESSTDRLRAIAGTEAQQYLAQIPDEQLRGRLASKMEEIQHVGNSVEIHEGSAIGSDFEAEFIDDSERVNNNTAAIAERLSKAHAELSRDGRQIVDQEVWGAVIESQLAEAVVFKEAGESDRAVDILAEMLVTTSLAREHEYLEHHQEKIPVHLQTAIASGLAVELIQAARQNHGLVSISSSKNEIGHVVESYAHSVAHNIEPVITEIELVTSHEVSLDPDDPALGEKLVADAVKERVKQLSLESAVATAKGVVIAEQHDAAQKSETIDQLTKQALKELPKATWGRVDKAEQLIQLSEANPSLSDPSKYQQEFQAIRNMRMVNTRYRINEQEIFLVDEALVELWEKGFKDLASRILTAGNEIEERGDYASGAIGHMVRNKPELMQEIKAEVERRQQECKQKLEAVFASKDEEDTTYGYSGSKRHIEDITQRVLTTQNPERATELILSWAKEGADAEKILSTLNLLSKDPVEGNGLNLLLILISKENPLTDIDEVKRVMEAARELSLRHYFPEEIVRDSTLLDNSEEGADIRSRVIMLHDEFPLDLFSNYFSTQKIKFFERVMENSDPQFVNNVKYLLEAPAISRLQNETYPGAREVVLKLLSGVVEADDAARFLNEQKAYLQSLEAMLAHPLFAKLKEVEEGKVFDSFNNLVLKSVTTVANPAEGIKNVEAVFDTELTQTLRRLHEIAPSEGVAGFIGEIAGSLDITKLAEDWQGLTEQLKLVAEHPLMDMLRPGGMLHNMAPAILNCILATENKVGFCENAYNSFTKPQPLWRSLTRFTELLVGQKVETLGAKQQHLVKTLPLIRLKLGVSAESAGVDEVAGFKARLFSSLTVEQKRLMATDQLAGLSDEEVSGLEALTFDRFTDRVKRALFAYQLEQTVEQSRDSTSKEQADSRNQLLALNRVPVIQEGDFIHGTAFDSLASILQDGNVAGEARRAASRADSYPFNVDLGVINGAETIQEKIENTISFGGYGKGGRKGEAGQVMLVYKRNSDSWMAGQETYPGEHHALVFGGIPSTEITGIVLTDPTATLSSVSRTVVENGFYVPLYDREGNILFSPDDYRQASEDLNMSVQIPPENIIDSSVKAEDQRGVSEGGIYLFPTESGPVRYYVKFAENPDHTWTEYAADELYRAAGVAVPDTRVVVVEGRLGRASRWVEEGSELPPSESSTLEDGAAMDMLLANWDVVFNSANTMMVNGKVLRPDSGSALDIWATGVPKLEGTWVDEVRELSVGNDRTKLWEGMRQEYPGLTDEQLRAQVQRIQERLTDDAIDRVVDSIRRPHEAREALKATLKARREDMVSKVLNIPTSLAA